MHFRHHKSSLADPSHRVKSSLQELVSATEDLLRSTAAESGSEMESARHRLRHQLDVAKDRLHEGKNRAERQYREISETGQQYVQEHPWRIVGMAIGVGLLVGACIMYEESRKRL